MKITRVEAVHVNIKLPRDFGGSIYSVPEKNAIVTRVYTDHGPVGEAINGEGSRAIMAATFQVLTNELIPMVIGEDATNIEAVWKKMWGLTHTSNRDRRQEIRAIACVDSALWDMKAKMANMPLYKLWGGAADRIPIIAIGGQYNPDYSVADYGKEMEFFRKIELAGCKFKVGGRSPEVDAERTRAALAGGGEGFVLCVDANRGWPLKTALDYARRVRELPLRWFEEPCHWDDDKRDMAAMRMLTDMPICSGQSESTLQGCRDMIREGAIDICNLDASWGGGPTVWLRAAKLAQAFGIEMAHHGEPVVGSHLIASVSNGTYMETHHPERDPVFHKMVQGRGKIAGGFYEMPTKPGWGIELDQGMIEKYKVSST